MPFFFKNFQKQWTVGKDNCVHLKPLVEKQFKKLPTFEFAEHTIEYARQLEMIV